MAAGEVQGGFGVKLKITVSAALTAVAHLLDVDFPEFEKLMADATAHDSTDGWDEVIPTGRKNSSEFEATLLWNADDNTHKAILDAFNADSSMPMTIEDPAGVEVIGFDGFITKMGRESKQDDGYKCVVTIKPTGVITITNAP